MTRVIKFRAWDRKLKKFMGNGDIVCSNYGDTQITANPNSIDYIHDSTHDYYEASRWEITQFTGLLDKNGTEVFEGDVIEFLLAPVELNHASSSDMFGTEPQNSWLECTQATYPVRASAEIFYNESELAYQIRNIKCKVLNIYDEDHDDKYEEDYCIADPNAVAGGADGLNFSLNDFYEDCIDFAIDVYMYNDLTFNDFLNIKIIGNIFENGDY